MLDAGCNCSDDILRDDSSSLSSGAEGMASALLNILVCLSCVSNSWNLVVIGAFCVSALITMGQSPIWGYLGGEAGQLGQTTSVHTGQHRTAS